MTIKTWYRKTNTGASMKSKLWKLIHKWRDAETTESAWIARDQIDVELDKIDAAMQQEPVAWRWVWKSKPDDIEGWCYTNTPPTIPELQLVEELYLTPGAQPEAIKEVVAHADYREMWQQVTKTNQELCEALSKAQCAQPVPEGYQLLKNTTTTERSFPEDEKHENGSYYCICKKCDRQFIGYKRRQICKACEAMLEAAKETK